MSTKSFILIAAILYCLIDFSTSNLIELCDAVPVNRETLFNICPYEQLNPLTLNYSQGSYDYVLTLSLVNASTTPCPNTPSSQVYATLFDNLDSDCYNIAVGDPTITALDSSDEGAGLLFTFPFNDPNSFDKQLLVQLNCDSSVTSANQSNFTITSVTDTSVIVSGASNYGCPYVSLSMLVSFLKKYEYVFVVIFAALGFFTCFFGMQMIKITIFIIAAVGGTMLSGSLFFEFTKLSTEKWALWLIFAACVIIGLVLGYIAVKIETLGFIALGIVLGGIGGLYLYNAVLAPFLGGKKAALYVTIAVLSIIGGGLAYKFWDKIVILATAFIGSYMLIRAISVPIGGFPSEDSIASGVAKFSAVTYAYLIAIAIIGIIGGIVQFKRKAAEDEINEEKGQYAGF